MNIIIKSFFDVYGAYQYFFYKIYCSEDQVAIIVKAFFFKCVIDSYHLRDLFVPDNGT